jgi:hypothetical protein
MRDLLFYFDKLYKSKNKTAYMAVLYKYSKLPYLIGLRMRIIQ